MCSTAQRDAIREEIRKMCQRGATFTAMEIYDNTKSFLGLSKGEVAKEVSKAYSEGLFPKGYVCQMLFAPDGEGHFKLYLFDNAAYSMNDSYYNAFKRGQTPSVKRGQTLSVKPPKSAMIRCGLDYDPEEKHKGWGSW